MSDILIRKGLGAVTCALILASPVAHARTVYLLDFDGTITDDQGARATWRTPWILRRIDVLRNLLQNDVPDLPETVAVSYREYRRLAPRLGRGAGQIGAPGTAELDFDALAPERELIITPGRYAVSDDITFKHYRPAQGRGRSHLVEDLKRALARANLMRARGEDGDWRGPAFPLVRHALRSAATADDLILFTARTHSQSEWRRFFRVLKEEGQVIYAPARPRVHSMTDPESLQFARGGIGEKKAGLLSAKAFELANDARDRHAELSPDEYEAARDVTRLGHTLIVGDEEPRIVETLRREIRDQSSDLYTTHRIKFVLFNAGAEEDVAAAYFPWRYTVIHKGSGRPATADEIALWTGAQNCQTFL